MRRFVAAVLILAPLSLAAPARADVAPPPTRPAWNEHPAPEPDPPPEKPLERLALTAAALALLGLGVARAAQARRGEVRS